MPKEKCPYPTMDRLESHVTTSAPIINYLANTLLDQTAAVFNLDISDKEAGQRYSSPQELVTATAVKAVEDVDSLLYSFEDLSPIPQLFQRYLKGEFTDGNQVKYPHYTASLIGLLREGTGTGITMAASIANLYLHSNIKRTLADASAYLKSSQATVPLLILSNTGNGLLEGGSFNPRRTAINSSEYGDLPSSFLSLAESVGENPVVITEDGLRISDVTKKHLKHQKTLYGNRLTDGCPARKSHSSPSQLAIDVAGMLCIEPSELSAQPSPIITAANCLALCIDTVIEQSQ